MPRYCLFLSENPYKRERERERGRGGSDREWDIGGITHVFRFPMLLGDLVSTALAAVSITEETVSAWLGRPCDCEERRRKLNSLHAWALRVIKGKTVRAEEHLSSLMGQEDATD